MEVNASEVESFLEVKHEQLNAAEYLHLLYIRVFKLISLFGFLMDNLQGAVISTHWSSL